MSIFYLFLDGGHDDVSCNKRILLVWYVAVMVGGLFQNSVVIIRPSDEGAVILIRVVDATI